MLNLSWLTESITREHSRTSSKPPGPTKIYKPKISTLPKSATPTKCQHHCILGLLAIFASTNSSLSTLWNPSLWKPGNRWYIFHLNKKGLGCHPRGYCLDKKAIQLVLNDTKNWQISQSWDYETILFSEIDFVIHIDWFFELALVLIMWHVCNMIVS